MARQLDTQTLDNYGRQFAVWWIQGHQSGFPERDRAWLKQEFYNLTFKDEFEYLFGAVQSHLVGGELDAFKTVIGELTTKSPRSDKVLKKELANRLAIDADGNHIPGKIGSTIVGSRIVGKRMNRRGVAKAAYWPIYAGEDEERAVNSGVADPLPDPDSLFNDDAHLRPFGEA